MAAVIAPVELPTGRRSYLNTTPTPDIHDPNWIPVLDGAGFHATSSQNEKDGPPFAYASFSLFPAPSSSPKPRPVFSHNYSKSSLAPESLASDSRPQSRHDNDGPPLPRGGPVEAVLKSENAHDRRHASTGSVSAEEKISVGTRTTAGDGGSALSTEESVNIEETARPSSRPSMASSLRTTVLPPTSKYNRKPVPSMAPSMAPSTGRPSFAPSLPQTPQDSPRLGASRAVTAPSTPLVQSLPSPRLPPMEPPPEPETVPRVHPAKSSASERRQRALHSHPSNISLRSQRNSSSDDTEAIPRPSSVRKPRKSTDSRATTPRSTIYESQMPTPAPTTPLPQLPPQARRPSTKLIGSPVTDPGPLPLANFRPLEHTEMASFMTETNTVVFRRFDDVHVRLLLCLQDEISQLEGELARLESPTSTVSPTEKTPQKMRVLRELRKVVAEYGEDLEIQSART